MAQQQLDLVLGFGVRVEAGGSPWFSSSCAKTSTASPALPISVRATPMFDSTMGRSPARLSDKSMPAADKAKEGGVYSQIAARHSKCISACLRVAASLRAASQSGERSPLLGLELGLESGARCAACYCGCRPLILTHAAAGGPCAIWGYCFCGMPSTAR